MRIGVDGGCWSNRRGYGRFLREILQALAKVDRENQYVVFLDQPACQEFHLGPPFRAVRVELSQPIGEAASAGGSRSVTDLLRMSRALSSELLDLFFFPSVYSYFPVLHRIPILVGIHDAIAHRDPKMHFDSWKQALFWRMKVRLAIDQASLILTVSEYSKRCLHELLGVSLNRMRVLHEGAAHVFRKFDCSGPDYRYVLYVGGFSPHKNLATLARSFRRSRARSNGVRLVLAGDHQSDPFKGSYSELRQLVSDLGLQNEVIFTDFVPDEELCRLYNRASAVVLPSLEEGFGLPALEAMSCGVPVVASAGTALDEVVGDAGLLVDALDEAGFAEAIDRILEDADFARDLSTRSLDRAVRFSWDIAARRLLQIFGETRTMVP